ncbi:unnamed protein product [Rotaria sp. Silwood1]|nr:unnamed protein product [Rotaria sp. Silwood1]
MVGFSALRHRDCVEIFNKRAVILLRSSSTAPLEFHDAVIDDPKQHRPDITLAKLWLNWTPRVSLNEGLNKTIEYFRNELRVKHHSERNIFFPPENLHSSNTNTINSQNHNEF